MTSLASLPASVLSKYIIQTLSKQNIDSVEETLRRPSLELGYILQLPLKEIRSIRAQLAKHLATQKVITHPSLTFGSIQCGTALEFVHRSKPPISLGDYVIDQALNGGLICGTLIELSGCAGSGKSTFALQAVCHALMYPPATGQVIWICTHGQLPITRLVQIWISMQPTQALPMDRILTQRIVSADALCHFMTYLLPTHLSRQAAKQCTTPLIIIDCLAELFRGILSLPYRSKVVLMNDLVQALHRVSAMFSSTVLVTNQVMPDLLFDEKQKCLSSPRPDYLNEQVPMIRPDVHCPPNLFNFDKASNTYTRRITTMNLTPLISSCLTNEIPALGLEWSRLIHHRILLTKTKLHNPDYEKRELRVLAGFQVPIGTVIEFKIDDGGVTGIISG